MLKTLESKIRYRISRSKDNVFILNDFADLSDKDQISRALRKLEKKQFVARISRGMYAKLKKSKFKKDKITLTQPLPFLAKEALGKIGVETFPTRAFLNYNSGRSTQVPTGRRIGVKKRVTRKIKYNGAKIYYEYIT